MVSQDKIRYDDENFDLDLSYITPRIIAMGFPASGIESSYRNPASQVADFLETKHKGHYKVINLTETPYHDSVFPGPVFDCPFPDHHAPPFEKLLQVMKVMDEWYKQDEQNVIAVHCLAGMGRTGTVISSFMILEGIEPNADTALTNFAIARTGNKNHGVNYPSQIRYVHYMESYIIQQENPFLFRPLPSVTLILSKITCTSPYPSKQYRPTIIIFDSLYDVKFNSAWLMHPELHTDFSVEPDLSIKGDFTIKLYSTTTSITGSKTVEISRASFNTCFIIRKRIELGYLEIDGPHRDKVGEFSDTFKIMIDFING